MLVSCVMIESCDTFDLDLYLPSGCFCCAGGPKRSLSVLESSLVSLFSLISQNFGAIKA